MDGWMDENNKAVCAKSHSKGNIVLSWLMLDSVRSFGIQRSVSHLTIFLLVTISFSCWWKMHLQPNHTHIHTHTDRQTEHFRRHGRCPLLLSVLEDNSSRYWLCQIHLPCSRHAATTTQCQTKLKFSFNKRGKVKTVSARMQSLKSSSEAISLRWL